MWFFIILFNYVKIYCKLLQAARLRNVNKNWNDVRYVRNYSFSNKNYQFLSQRKPHFYDSIRNEIRTSKYEYYYLCSLQFLMNNKIRNRLEKNLYSVYNDEKDTIWCNLFNIK